MNTKNILRVTFYPTSKFNKVGYHCYQLHFQQDYQTYFVSPRLEGVPLNVPVNSKLKRFSFLLESSPKTKNWFKKHLFNVRRVISITLFSLRTIAYITNKRIDIIHLHSPMFIPIGLFGRLLKKNVYITFHGEDFERIKDSRLYSVAQGMFSGVFTVASNTIRQLELIHNVKVCSVFNGCDERFINLKWKRKRQIIFVGAFKPVKDHLLMLNGFREFVQQKTFSDYKLLLVGEGDMLLKIKGVVKEMGLEHKVIFAGQLDVKELVEMYNQCEVFALTSLREGFPKVILEALSCGCKVITTKVGSVTQVMGEDYPYFINDRTPQEVCKKLVQVCTKKPEEFKDYENIPQNYSWDGVRDLYSSVYSK